MLLKKNNDLLKGMRAKRAFWSNGKEINNFGEVQNLEYIYISEVIKIINI